MIHFNSNKKLQLVPLVVILIMLTSNLFGQCGPIASGTSGGNANHGIEFDVVALNSVRIDSLHIVMFDDFGAAGGTTSTDVYLLYKMGTHVGFYNDQAAWTSLGVVNVTQLGNGQYTPIPLPINVVVPAGQTIAFYLITWEDIVGNTDVLIKYGDGAGGGPSFNDANLQIMEGSGVNGDNGAFWGTASTWLQLEKDPKVKIFYECINGSDAGIDQTNCINSALLGAIGGEGTWSVNSGTGTFANPADSNTVVTGLSLGLNQFVWTITATNESDTVDITVNTIDIGISQIDDITLQATSVTANYQWVDCNNNFSALVGEINQNFSATQNGSYAVVLTESGCSDTSACVSINNVGISENDFGNKLIVYPNPTSGIVYIDLGSNYEAIEVKLINPLGQLLSTSSFVQTDHVEFEINSIPGIYFIEIMASNGKKAIIKLLKE
ncbi:MAG: T9SS type A sorting domain-containing protein [Crocinitomicaceae bacterium]|nr:T9SS type A sorting domain-containing protein [Crocinitomicaceae bacterium]